MSTQKRRGRLTRRRFVARGAMALGALGALGSSRARGANDRISIGVIGCGGRGSALLGEALGLRGKHDAEVTAVCDVWKPNLERAADAVAEASGKAPRKTTRFGELLAFDDVDAVIIATPDFGHTPILIEALKADKDAYVEKPMSLEIPMANQALDLARSRGRIVQAGTQRRSEGAFLGAAKVLADGTIGKITRFSVAVHFNEPRWARGFADCKEADVDWDAFLFNRPKRPFDAKLLRRWHLYKECTNGLSGLWMAHYADLVCLLTGARYPASAVAHGGIYVWKDGREHTDVFHALIDYPEGFLFDWAMSLTNSAGSHFRVHGTLGTLDLDTLTVSPAGARPGTGAVELKVKPEPNRSHMGNWLECIRSRARPAADIECGHQHAVATILAANALESGRRQAYDPATRSVREA